MKRISLLRSLPRDGRNRSRQVSRQAEEGIVPTGNGSKKELKSDWFVSLFTESLAMFYHDCFRHRSGFLVFGALSVLIIGLGMAPHATGSGADSEKLKTLLDEHRAVLGEAVRLAEQGYRAGRTDIDSVLTLQRELFEAELELAESGEQRLELYWKLVEHSAGMEKVSAERFKTGQATQVDVLKAKAVRLQSQIDLERAKLNDNAP